MRSLLFVPGDSRRKFEKALQSTADAIILDLEDAIAPEHKAAARSVVAQLLAELPRGDKTVYVRINALETGLALTDLAAVMPLCPDGIMLPKCRAPEQLRQLDFYLDAFEAAAGTAPGHTRTIALVAETADSILALPSYRGCGPRLWGMTWGAEDLAASLGALANRKDGDWLDPYRLARSLCLTAAAANGVVAIDAVCVDIGDLDRLSAETAAARRDGFGAKAVIHPSHIDVVNAGFTPAAAEVEWARKVVAAFAAENAGGVLRLEGKMLDQPHLRAAENVLAQAARAERAAPR